jgi:hypothetical protein
MKTQLALGILALGIASSAFGSTCVQGTLSSYAAPGFSCTVGAFTFNNFNFLAVNVLSSGNAADIMVDPTVGPNGPNVTFTADSTLQASGLVSVLNYILGFEVTSTNPNIGFQAVNLGATGTLANGPLGVSTAAVAEVDCYGGLLQLPNVLTGIVGLGCLNSGVAVGANVALPLGTNVTASVPIEFSGFSTTVDVLKDITLVAALGGSASISSISQGFTTENQGGTGTPEPASFFMGGCGLVALALIGRRRIKKPSMTV